MSTNIDYSESLARIACIAAIELEKYSQNRDTHLDYVKKFMGSLSANMNMDLEGSVLTGVDSYAIDSSTAYAVNDAIFRSDIKKKAKNAEELVSSVREYIMTPLHQIVDSDQGGVSIPKEAVEALSSICLLIAKAYSSLDLASDHDDDHPLR